MKPASSRPRATGGICLLAALCLSCAGTPLGVGEADGDAAPVWYGLEGLKRPRPSATPRATPTPQPTTTPTPPPTATPTPAPSPGASPTPTPAPTPGPSATPTPGASATPTPGASATPTPRPSATPTPTPTPTPKGGKPSGSSADGTLVVTDGEVVNPTAPEGIGLSP